MALFKANCASCHGVDKKLVGPALTGVWDRWESEEKLIAWVQNSSKFLATGDPYANKLFNEYNKSAMSAFPQLTPEQIKSILVYIKNPAVASPAASVPAGAPTAASTNGSSTGLLWALFGFLCTCNIIMEYNFKVR
jgi:mono/diheme cytochrome c family protein